MKESGLAVYARSTFDGHELVTHHYEPLSGLCAIVAIHARREGRACGGCRMWPYPDDGAALDDVLRLSKAMSYKAAMADVPAGGAKAVIIGDPSHDKTQERLRAMGRLIDSFGGRYVSAPDVGIGADDLRVFRDETKWVVGVDQPSAPYTALGVFSGICALVRHMWGRSDLEGLRVAIQGVGSVGRELAKQVTETGARLLVADIDPVAVDEVVDLYGGETMTIDEILFADVDVISPCALGEVFNDYTIPRIRAPMVCGAANNQLADDRHGRALRRRGITYAPDYVVSAGGLIAGMEELSGFDASAARQRVEQVGETLTDVLVAAERDGVSESEAADHIAEQEVRRWREAA